MENEQNSPYPKGKTALIVVDPLNDLISEGGMGWPMSGEVIQEVQAVEHIEELLKISRDKEIKVVYAQKIH